MRNSIIFSGMQPSGELTIGNYIGAIKQWINMQKKYNNCIYCIADLHALTNKNNIKKIEKNSLDTLALYLSAGINPEKSIIFMQSHVPEHTQLNWILNCCVYFGEIFRMTQFKNFIKKNKEECNIGILNYPVLMASDILLYQSNKVPIGKDQKQHLELSRIIAKRFNRIYGNIFPIPEPIINQYGSCIMSLLNPKKKMSKSDTNKNNTIFLLENPDFISMKLNRAITDSDNPPKIYYDPIAKPGVSNLLNILSSFTRKPIKSLEKEFFGKTYKNLKETIIDILIEKLSSLNNKYNSIRCEESYLRKILNTGSEKARFIASLTLKKVYKAVNLFF